MTLEGWVTTDMEDSLVLGYGVVGLTGLLDIPGLGSCREGGFWSASMRSGPTALVAVSALSRILKTRPRSGPEKYHLNLHVYLFIYFLASFPLSVKEMLRGREVVPVEPFFYPLVTLILSQVKEGFQ